MSAATIALADVRGTKDTLWHMGATRRADALKWAELGPAGARRIRRRSSHALDLAARLILEMDCDSNAGGAR
jgi:hypothetical protein